MKRNIITQRTHPLHTHTHTQWLAADKFSSNAALISTVLKRGLFQGEGIKAVLVIRCRKKRERKKERRAVCNSICLLMRRKRKKQKRKYREINK